MWSCSKQGDPVTAKLGLEGAGKARDTPLPNS